MIAGRKPGEFLRERSRTAVALAGLRLRRAGTTDDAARGHPTVVSLTTFPARSPLVHRTIASLLRQSTGADRVVLVLASDEFDDVPRNVRPFLSTPGFELLWTDHNIRSYKKLLPVLERYPAACIVTADDDVIYPRHWLRNLVALHERFPDDVVCGRGLAVRCSTEQGGEYPLTPYGTWPPATSETDPRLVFPTGVSGILYPPGALDARVTDAVTAGRVCPDGDDIWFKAMALLAGTGARVVSSLPEHLPGASLGLGGPTLTSTNVGGGRNDVGLRDAWRTFGAEIEAAWRS